MGKREKLLSATLLITVFSLLILYWAFNHKIISGKYEKLTITSTEETDVTINDQTEIERVIAEINQSPRSLKIDNGFTYDYLHHGILSFENDTEKVEIGFIIKNGNTLTRYWEIDTDLNFEGNIEK